MKFSNHGTSLCDSSRSVPLNAPGAVALQWLNETSGNSIQPLVVNTGPYGGRFGGISYKYRIYKTTHLYGKQDILLICIYDGSTPNKWMYYFHVFYICERDAGASPLLSPTRPWPPHTMSNIWKTRILYIPHVFAIHVPYVFAIHVSYIWQFHIILISYCKACSCPPDPVYGFPWSRSRHRSCPLPLKAPTRWWHLLQAPDIPRPYSAMRLPKGNNACPNLCRTKETIIINCPHKRCKSKPDVLTVLWNYETIPIGFVSKLRPSIKYQCATCLDETHLNDNYVHGALWDRENAMCWELRRDCWLPKFPHLTWRQSKYTVTLQCHTSSTNVTSF